MISFIALGIPMISIVNKGINLLVKIYKIIDYCDEAHDSYPKYTLSFQIIV